MYVALDVVVPLTVGVHLVYVALDVVVPLTVVCT